MSRASLAGGLHLYRESTAAPPRSPEETVGWDPADAIARTAKDARALVP